MKFVTFKGEKISKLSLGTVQFGLDYGIANSEGKPTQERVDSIIDYVYSSGINSFDTAQAYGNAEEVLGEALEDKKEIFIVSKLKSELFENNLDSNISSSLSNLKHNALFGLLLHDSKLLYRWSEQHTTLVNRLIERKKIAYFGVSIYTNEDFELAINNDKIQIIQIPFNLFDQRAITQKWFEKAKETNKLIFIRSIFLQGLFFMDSHTLQGNLVEAQPYLEKLHQIKKRLDLSISELAMAYVDSVAKESILLFGCDTLEQAKENISNYNQLPHLSQEILDEITLSFSDIPEEISNPTLWSSK